MQCKHFLRLVDLTDDSQSFRYGVTAGAEAFASSVASGIEGVLVSSQNVVSIRC